MKWKDIRDKRIAPDRVKQIQTQIEQEMKNDIRTYNALTEIPENLSVGELNQAVRDLRELLHEQTLKTQELEERILSIFDSKKSKKV